MVEFPFPPGLKTYGVQTVTILENGYGGVIDVEVFAVVYDGSESIEKIFVNAPLDAEFFGYGEDGVDGGAVVGLDVGAPLGVIVVDPVGEGWE